MPRHFILACALLSVASIPSAKPFATGCVQGKITNESGPVGNASVEIRNIMNGFLIHTDSGPDGAYTFSNLHAGRYSLWVQAPGNDSVWIPQLFVEDGQVTHQTVRLARNRGPIS